MAQDRTRPKRPMSITTRHAQEKKHECILCPDHKTQGKQNYYDIEIHTTETCDVIATLFLLGEMKKESEDKKPRLTFKGDYQPDNINMNLCEIHYRNLSDRMPLNQRTLMFFTEFSQLFKSEKKETVQ